MSIETTLPYSWLRNIAPNTVLHDEIPLWGSPPPFPWDNYASILGKALQIQNFRLIPGDVEWRSQDRLTEGMGQNPHLLTFQASPIEDTIYWLLPQEDLRGLLRLTVGSTEKLSELEALNWSEEFYYFLANEALLAFQKVKFDPKLNPQLTKENAVPSSTCLCVDIEINAGTHAFHGRLIFTPEVRASIKQHYASKSISYPPGMASALTTEVHLVAGSTILSAEEWKSLSPGDFLLLDSCTLTLENDKGRIQLVVNDKPIFRGKIKDGNIKILEYPLLQEVQTPMAKEEEHFEDEELFEDDESEIEDEEHFEEESLVEDTAQESIADEEEEEDEVPPPQTAAPATTPLQHAFAKPQEIPLTISVEVGRLVMSLQQLMELTPGNVLELNVHPENGVDLVVNGRCIGKGELLKIGEVLGVRILDKA